MVYLRGLFVNAFCLSTLVVWLVMVMAMMTSDVESAATKIAYKKPIFGKTNAIKEKRSRTRPEILKKMALTLTTGAPTTSTTTTETATTIGAATTTPTIAMPLAPTEVTISETTTPLSLLTVKEEEDHAMAASTSAAAASAVSAATTAVVSVGSSNANSSEEAQHATPQDIQFLLINKTQDSAEILSAIQLVNNTLGNAVTLEEEEVIDTIDGAVQHGDTKEEDFTAAEDDIEDELLPTALELIAPRPTSTTSTTKSANKSTTTVTSSNAPVPCTCGVFMTSQIKRGSNEQPQGAPVIMNELDRTYPCNSVGQKQCQTKCLETIVQHLPNSANILCATLNRDCRKERAYLYIKNCQNHWWNTSLTAGREYCCRNGQPYKCPII